MVWQETRTIAIVIMLTQTVENGIVMSSEYFPSDPGIPAVSYVDNESGDHFTATISDRVVHSWKPQGVLSTMQLSVDRKGEIQTRSNESQINERKPTMKSKEVLHYQFIAWPESRLPEAGDREALINFSGASRLAEEDRNGSPRIVHCGASNWRTGTFIALDFLLGEIEDGAMEDSDMQTDMIFDTVVSLRSQRNLMVPDLKSYEFLYETIKEDLARKLALEAKQAFLARWSKVLVSASVMEFDYRKGIFRIDGSSVDGADRSISRSMDDLCDLHYSLSTKFRYTEYEEYALLSFQELQKAFQEQGSRPDLRVLADRYIQVLACSIPPEIMTSTKYLEFFAPLQHDLMPFQSEATGEESIKRNENEEEEKAFQNRMKATLLKAGYSDASIEKTLLGELHSKDDTGPEDIHALRPTYIKVHRKHLSPDTLDIYDLPWEWDDVSHTNLESVMTIADDV